MDCAIKELESIIRNRICGVCTERSAGESGSALEQVNSCSVGCALFQLFPQVARTIQSVSSNDITQYVDAIRRQVCSVCPEQAEDGSCEHRRQVKCALDAYLLLVVDAIEEATGKIFDRSRVPILPAGPAVGPGPQIRL